MAYKDFKEFGDDLQKILEEATSAPNMQAFGEKAKDIIYKRTKSGKGVTSDTGTASLKALTKLSKAYIDKRKKNPPTGEFGAPARSNLTNTGQMLDSITVASSKGKVEVTIPPSVRTDGKTNSEVAGHVSDNGRPFMNLAQSEVKILTKDFENLVRELARLLVK